MVLNATYFRYIVAVSLIGGGNRSTERPVERNRRTLSHNVVSSTPHHERDSNSQHQWY